MNLNVDPLLTLCYIPHMTVNVNYPLPTVHLNGTSRDMLLKGEMKVHDALNELSEAMSACTFHSRDYYLQDDDPYSYESYNKAKEERMKHIENLRAFKQYNLEQVMHIRSS